jgi:NAD(P)-dependent dehydrogenase (short-subunit alcohol dehydrogenase family)
MLVAGYQQWDRLGILDAEGLRKHFEVNAIGPILIVQALRPNLKPGSKVSKASAFLCASFSHLTIMGV